MIGINPARWNPIGTAQSFVTSYGLTFTNLRDDTNAVHRRYGSPSTSNYWLLDKHGNRVGDTARYFSTNGAESLLDDLE